VLELDTGRVSITSQNHGFAVDEASMPADLRVTHLNLNDRTVEGFAHRELPVFSVQYHPEASPGPHDAEPLFDRFVQSMRTRSRSGAEASVPALNDQNLKRVS
jgi:carbamoyl-phosphate synthase small subunit